MLILLLFRGTVCWNISLRKTRILMMTSFPRYWPFVRGIYLSPVNSPHKGQWRGALMFSLICVWINGWVNNREAGDLRRYRTHYDVIVMFYTIRYWPSYPEIFRFFYYSSELRWHRKLNYFLCKKQTRWYLRLLTQSSWNIASSATKG